MDPQAAELVEKINRVFPPTSKPADTDLIQHDTACVQCAWTGTHLEPFEGPILPFKALRGLHMEMSCLSAAGWRWALPSFLRYSLAGPHHDDLETESMIYFLGGVETSQPEARAGLALFDRSQLDCVLRVLEWCSTNPHWSNYCGSEAKRAVAFMKSLRDERHG